MTYSLNALYKVVEISKQAVAKQIRKQEIFEEQFFELLIQIDSIREEHPGCGVEKMYYTLKPSFIGRDAFIDYLMALGYRVKYNKNYRRTTIASKLYYPNLIKGMIVNRPNQIWQSDITYFEIADRFYYGVFIIDIYTKEIVGYNVSDNMRATANLKALKSAINKYGKVEIHHSDRGSQYVSKKYTALLKEHETQISMGLTAQDNAYAERINRTIKEEYLNHWKVKNYIELKRAVKKAVNHYNNKRLHNSLLPYRITPSEFRKKVINLQEQDRPKVMIYTEGNNKIEVASSHLNLKQDLTQDQNCPKYYKDDSINKTVNLI